jgi:integrase
MTSKRNTGLPKITKHPDGTRYWVRLELGYVDGKRKRKAVYGKTVKEVAEKAAKLMAQRDSGINIAPERLTVEQFFSRWLDDAITPRVRPTTLHTYRTFCRLHIYPHLGRILLGKLTAQHIQRLLRTLQQQGLSHATVRQIYGVVRAGLTTAAQWECVPRNVATLVTPPRPVPYHARVLTTEQAHRLLDAVVGHRLEALYRVALSLGLRHGELLGLRWQDVDLDAGTLRVAMTLLEVRGGLVLAEPKTPRSHRTLPLSPLLTATLRQHRARQLAERMRLGPAWHDHGMVFASETGTPIRPRNMRRAFRSLLLHAGLPHVRIHDLRHSCATFLALQRVPPRIAMDILGHSNITTTLAIYTHVLEGSTVDAVLQMDALFAAREAG